MYSGHLAVALAVKGKKQKESVVLLITATLLVDLIDGLLGLMQISIPGIGGVHNLPGTIITAILFSGLVLLFSRKIRKALLYAAIVLSHILLDYISSRLFLWPGGPRFGLGLYNLSVLDFFVEGLLVFGGWLVYRQSIRQVSKPHWPLYTLLFYLLGLQALFNFAIW